MNAHHGSLLALILGTGCLGSVDIPGGDTPRSPQEDAERPGDADTPSTPNPGPDSDPDAASPTSATLAWLPPSASANGSALTDLAGYVVRWGRGPGTYAEVADIGTAGCAPAATGTECTHSVPNLTSGRWYFVVHAYDIAGNESVASNEATKLIP